MESHIEEHRDVRHVATSYAGTDLEENLKESNEYTPSIEYASSLPQMGGGKPYPPYIKNSCDYMVTFDENDPEYPQNYSSAKKIIYITSILVSCFSSLYGSAVLSAASLALMKEFKTGTEVVTLCTSLFVFGYASGPVVWGPLSEVHGRKIVILISIFIFTCLNFACATAKDLQTLIICRFFSGFASGAVMVIGPAVIGDLFPQRSRGNIVTLFASIIFGGPMLAPIISGFIVKNHSLGWRWCLYISGIISAFSLVLISFFFEETNPGILLSRRAHLLRVKTDNWSIYAEKEREQFSITGIITKVITRPIHMLIVEPILLSITIYNSFVMGLMYLFLTEIPMIFGPGGYNFSDGVSSLPYLAILLGVEIGALCNLYFEKRYLEKVAKAGKLVPEERLFAMLVGAICLPCGIFWLSWAGKYSHKVHWIVPVLGNIPIGVGLICLFLPSLNYLIECYLPFVASAMAGNTVMRYFFGGAFPLFARQMFDALGINWGGSLLGFFSVALIPMPLLFYRFGKRLRQKSKFALKL
ncbi:Piso0_005907 [Millerozyma farinosa CBS 7064]|uniref:Piso0_005907 protein n=1 Tax=Pichia sorbitophila (strain ATCC MYA-4447 / BCRC 22081 / CBS 7064 / NBRC 10061 / NRRL Y-12695) TaxID=559304 RepID=G8Y098_PICSO|nr:Piso0_005907 [Millerozyma farinosa CBS 7064]